MNAQKKMKFEIDLLIDLPLAISRLEELFRTEWAPWYGEEGQGNAKADLRSCLNRDRLPTAVVAHDKNGRILGTAALKNESLGSELGYGPWLAAVVVDPAFRARGVGSALIRSVEEQAVLLNYTELYTSTNTASSIVERLGWQFLNQSVPSLRGPISIYRRVFR